MKTILSASVKGGVGKTTVAVETARALRRRGFKVGVLDLDYRGPCVPIVLDTEASSIGRTQDDALVPAVSKEGIYVFSMAYLWPPEKCVMVEDSDAADDVQQLLRPGVISWPDLDYLMVDTPPTSSGIVRVVLESSQAAGAILVSHPSKVSLADTLRTLDLFAEKQVPVYALVSNQGLDEETGSSRYDLHDRDVEKLALAYRIPIFLVIPHTREPNRYFDFFVARIVATDPVVLPKPAQPEVKSWERIIKWAQATTKKS